MVYHTETYHYREWGIFTFAHLRAFGREKNLSNYAVMSIFSQLVLFFRRFSVGEGGPIELIPKSTSMLIRCDNWAQIEKEILVEI